MDRDRHGDHIKKGMNAIQMRMWMMGLDARVVMAVCVMEMKSIR